MDLNNKKIEKGDRGYLLRKKHFFGGMALACLIVVLGIFFTGIFVTGSRKNIFTVVAVVGVLPVAKFAVDFMMVAFYKPVEASLYGELEATAPSLKRRYECVFTTKERGFYVPALVISKGLVLMFVENGSASTGDVTSLVDTVATYARVAGCHVKAEVIADRAQFLKKAKRMNDSVTGDDGKAMHMNDSVNGVDGKAMRMNDSVNGVDGKSSRFAEGSPDDENAFSASLEKIWMGIRSMVV